MPTRIAWRHQALTLRCQRDTFKQCLLRPPSASAYTRPMLTFLIEAPDHNRRVDSFLRNLLPKAPSSYLKKLLNTGHLSVNGTKVPPETHLKYSDSVTLKESGKTASFLAPRPFLDILYEDSWVIAINKVPGLSVHRTEDQSEPNLVNLAEKFLAQRLEPVKLRPVNRLDKGTSGAVLLAKNAVAAGMFGRMVKEVGLGKLYLAAVQGQLASEGVIDLPLGGKESQTQYLRLLQREEAGFVAVYPVTGRMHQIRQHFTMIGHPIFGDLRYGGIPIPSLGGHALHSFTTTFCHPATEQPLIIPAPLPQGLLQFLMEVLNLTPLSVREILDQIPLQLGHR